MIPPLTIQAFSFKSNPQNIVTLYKKGKLSSVKYGLYGGKLSPKTATKEHIRPKCKKGSNNIGNIAIATKENNNARGCQPLEKCLTKDMLDRYLNQFKDLVVDWFNGNEYIKLVRQTVNTCIKKGW